MKSNDISFSGGGAPVAFHVWRKAVGIDEVTSWRWRRRGWIKTINIAGRNYITPEAIAEFNRRAAAGEFARQHPTPSRPELAAA